MIFEQIAVGGGRNFSYVIAAKERGQACVVDPAYNINRIYKVLEAHSLKVIFIINTHGHYDHVDGNARLQEKTGAKIVMHKSSAGDIGVDDEDELLLDDLALKFIYTPGHTPDSMCILVGNKLVTGDTLFVGKVGGTGFGEDAKNEYNSLQNKLMVLPDDIEVYPGHDYGTKPFSTIGEEKRSNPFILQKNFSDFIDIKMNWGRYKREHNIH